MIVGDEKMGIVYSQYTDETFHFNYSKNTGSIPDGGLLHSHDVCEILFFKTAGDILYMVDGRNYKIKENMLVLSRPTERHGLLLKGEDYERYEIWFDEKRLPFNLYEKIPKNLHVIDFDENEFVINIFKKMEYYVERLSGNDLRRVLENLVEEVFFNIMLEAENSNASYTKSNSIVYKAVEYIEEHLLDLNGIDEICEHLFVTKSHLHHLFVEYLNISPKKYIMHKKLTFAKREIYFGKKATDVCTECGFADYSAFYRAYKKHFGISPTANRTGQINMHIK